MKKVEINTNRKLVDYAQYAKLEGPVKKLTEVALELVPRIGTRKVWMINSTPQGGGVAEMLPTLISLMRELGVDAEWLYIETDNKAFFDTTKRIHNAIHGEGLGRFTSADRKVFEEVNKENADQLLELIKPYDIVVVHDPQPMPIIKFIKGITPLNFVWRCHIGLDGQNITTQAAWEFLKPYLLEYDQVVFTAEEYVPRMVKGRATIIHPSIPPLTPKNRSISMSRLVGVLVNADLARQDRPSHDARWYIRKGCSV